MRWSLLVVALLVLGGGVARADVVPDEPPTLPDTSCVGKAAGTPCGDGGRCVAQKVRRPDFSKGSPPTWVVTEVLVCQGGRVSSFERSSVVLGAGLAFLALVGGLALRGRRRLEPLAS